MTEREIRELGGGAVRSGIAKGASVEDLVKGIVVGGVIGTDDVRRGVVVHLFLTAVWDGVYDSRARSLIITLADALLNTQLHSSSTSEAINAVQYVAHFESEISHLVDMHGFGRREDESTLKLNVNSGDKDEDCVGGGAAGGDKEGSVVAVDAKTIGDRNRKDGKGRWVLAGVATVAGGAMIGLTAGMAAPLIVTGLHAAICMGGAAAGAGAAAAGAGAALATAMGGATGVAVIATSGAVTGGGLTGYKMLKRTRGVSEFEFISVEVGRACIERRRALEHAGVFEGVDVIEKGDGDTMSQAASSTAPITSTQPQPSRRRKLNVIITVSGWLTKKKGDTRQEQQRSRDDYTLPFSTLSEGYGEQYALVWESEVLETCGSLLSLVAGEVASFLFQQGLQAFVLPTLMAGLALPLWTMKLSYMVDNPWGIALDKAKKVGRLLADVLLSQVQENRPVRLVGFSLGARVIFYCLLELSTRGQHAYGIVEEVVLAGAPVCATAKQWAAVASVVSGRCVNAYLNQDWVLSVLYKGSGFAGLTIGTVGVAGLTKIEIGCGTESVVDDEVSAVPIPKTVVVENICLDGIVEGHLAYRRRMPRVLKACGYSVDAETFEEGEAEAEEEAKAAAAAAAEAAAKAQNRGNEISGAVSNPMDLFEELGAEWTPREIKSTLPPLVVSTASVSEFKGPSSTSLSATSSSAPSFTSSQSVPHSAITDTSTSNMEALFSNLPEGNWPGKDLGLPPTIQIRETPCTMPPLIVSTSDTLCDSRSEIQSDAYSRTDSALVPSATVLGIRENFGDYTHVKDYNHVKGTVSSWMGMDDPAGEYGRVASCEVAMMIKEGLLEGEDEG